MMKEMKKTLPGSVDFSQDRVLCPVPLNGHTPPSAELTSRILAELTNASICRPCVLNLSFGEIRDVKKKFHEVDPPQVH